MEAGGLASLGNFDSLLMRLLRPLGKGGVRLEQQSGMPRGNAGLSRQSGWSSPVMEANKCPARHRHDSAKKNVAELQGENVLLESERKLCIKRPSGDQDVAFIPLAMPIMF